jgi:Rod binding domain-containing protein
MNILPVNPGPKGNEIPLGDLARRTDLSETQKIQEVSRQFEAVLLRQILTEAQKPMLQSKGDADRSSDGFYRDLVIEQLAGQISRSNAMGVGAKLAQELSHQLGAKGNLAR